MGLFSIYYRLGTMHIRNRQTDECTTSRAASASATFINLGRTP